MWTRACAHAREYQNRPSPRSDTCATAGQRCTTRTAVITHRRSTSLLRRCSVVVNPSVQAKTLTYCRTWGQVLGTGCGPVEARAYALEATKKAICWPFLKPSDGLEPSTPSLPS